MIDERIKSYLKDRLKRLKDLKNERKWATSELDGSERWWTTAELGDMACCEQTLEFIDSLQEEPVSEDLEKHHKGETEGQNSSGIIGKDHLPEVRKKVAEKLLEASLNYYEAERACCEMHVPQEWKDERKKLYDKFIWTCQDYIVLNESDEVEEDELNYTYK